MKKIIIAILMILPFFAHAANMCIKNDAVMIVLDPQVGGTANGNSATGKTWSTKFSYGIISGVGGCYSNVGATQGGVASDQNITPYTSGTYCYCKMLKPAESAWVYSGYGSSAASYNNNCANYCASYCASNAASAVALRVGLFSTVGI